MATKVQIVDDHFLFAEALGSVIRDLPEYDLVGIAVTGPQAVSMTQEKQPEVILLDYHLPGYSADQLIPRLRNASPSSRVIILTSDTSEASLVKGIQAGVSGYLTKDRALDDVVQALRSVARGENILSDEQIAKVPQAQGDGEDLTQREIEILRLLARGRDSQAIADELTISSNTVRTHLQNIFAKLGAHSKLEAVALANRRGLLG
ncbi:MAG TPA: response regulator transcription factor [Candidatus Limnocylindria bacterium]|nr:response regulator transcription factor [Candidatus Limnocylindria bacterium]